MNGKKTNIIMLISILAFYLLIFVLEKLVPSYSMLFPVLKKTAVYAVVAVSMNLLNGFTGLFSLGQAGFMLIGAYTYGIFMLPEASRAGVYRMTKGVHWVDFSLTDTFGADGFGFVIAVVCALVMAGFAAAFFAWLIGLPVLRLKSDYLAIATLGFAEIIRAVFQWDKLAPLTNGANILNNFPYFTSTLSYWIIAGVCIALIVMLINSSYGRAFKAIRDDEIAAAAMGIDLAKHKQLAFVTSSFFAGVGGAMLAMYQCVAQASNFKTNMTYEILLIVVIGGMGSISGSVLASFLFTACNEWWLRFLDNANLGIPLLRGGFRKVVFSVIIMIIVLFFRKGMFDDKELPYYLKKLGQWIKAKFRKKQTAEAGKEGGAV